MGLPELSTELGTVYSEEKPKNNMAFEALRPEVINQGLIALSFAIPVLGMALSQRQREAIRDERDGHKCQAPFQHKCNGWGKNAQFNVHHISPQRFEEHEGIEEAQRDRPTNLITICTNAHDMIHPDNESMRRSFREKDQYKSGSIFAHRDELASRGIPYWRTTWDEAMRSVAHRLTEKAIKKGWVYPPHNHRNGNNGHNGT